MAKKGKKKPKKKKNEKKEISKSELKIDSEKFAGLIKKIKQPKKERLREDNEFHSFLHLSGDFNVPVLEQIAVAGDTTTSFFRIQKQQPTSNEKKEEESFKYLPSAETKAEPKYISSSATMHATGKKVDFEEVGRKNINGAGRIQEQFRQENLFMRSSELSREDPRNFETYETPAKMNIEEAGRENLFKKEQRKYEPKLPK